MNIGIYIYENAEVLDFSGPFEVFATAARLYNSKTPIKTAKQMEFDWTYE